MARTGYKSQYWLDRQEVKTLVASEKLSAAQIKESLKIYDQALRNVNKEIEAIYNRYSTRTGIDPKELKKVIRGTEKNNFLDKVVSKVSGLGFDVDEVYDKGFIQNITRMDALRQQVYWEVMQINPKENALQTETYKDIINNTYETTVFDNREGLGIRGSFGVLDKRVVPQMLRENWKGSNYSDRIWSNTDQLANELPYLIGAKMSTGQSYQKTTRIVRERFGVSTYNARRLVRTESNHFYNEAKGQGYEDDGFDEYRVRPIMDGRTSKICIAFDKADKKGVTYKTSERAAGETQPPFHGNCRTGTTPVLGSYTAKNTADKEQYADLPPKQVIPEDTESAFEYLSKKKGLDTTVQDDRPWYNGEDDKNFHIRLNENKTGIALEDIRVQDTGQGLGTELVNHVKDYAKAHNKGLLIRNTELKKFFDKFSWLKRQDLENGKYNYVYLPTKLKNKRLMKTSVPAPKKKLSTYKELSTWESKAAKDDFSSAAVFNKSTGKKIYSYTEEFEDNFLFNKRQLDQAKGNIISRNGKQNASITPEDIRVAIAADVAEVRVVSDSGKVQSIRMVKSQGKTISKREARAARVSERYEKLLKDGTGRELDVLSQEYGFQFYSE